MKKRPTKAPLFYNNQRRRAGMKPHRKANRKKKFFTRCEAIESVNALIDFWNTCE